MHTASPFYWFDPESVGSLHRKHAKGDHIAGSDVRKIAAAYSSDEPDDLLFQYMLREARGELTAKKGRRPYSAARDLRICIATDMVEERRREILAARRMGLTKRERGDIEPTVEAAENVSSELMLGLTGRALLNAISAQKKLRQSDE